jgi:hypothetical protein
VSFGLPPGTDPPDAPQPVASGEWFAHVIAQVRNDDGTVSVTFAMPHLTAMTVRVPLASWLNGEHSRLMVLPEPLLTALYYEPNYTDTDDSSG